MRSVRSYAFSLSLAIGLTMSLMTIAAAPGFAGPRASHFKLENGLEVVVIPDHRAPVVTHMVWYKVGAADEPRGRSGIAHFLEHLMFKGTKEIPPGEFSKIIARNGGQDNAFTSHDVTAYFQRVAKDRLPLIMEMEADRMANLRLLENDVVTERKVILEERSSRVDNDPSAILSEQMMASLYLSHPYGKPIIGWEHEINQLSRQDALDFYKRYYAPNNAILVVAGDVTAGTLRDLAEKTYGKLKPSEKLKNRERVQEPPPNAARRVLLKDPRAGKPTVQRHYHVPGYNTAEPGEAEALDLLMKVLASGTTSRLYKHMVVEAKKASSIGGWYSGTGLDSGRLSIYAVVSGDTPIAEIEAGIDSVIAKFQAEGVTQKELDRSRNAYIADYIYGTDSQSSLARRYGWGLATGGTIEEIENWPDRLKKVSVDDIVAVAKKYFTEKRSVTGVLLPVKKRSVDGKSAGGTDKSKS